MLKPIKKALTDQAVSVVVSLNGEVLPVMGVQILIYLVVGYAANIGIALYTGDTGLNWMHAVVALIFVWNLLFVVRHCGAYHATKLLLEGKGFAGAQEEIEKLKAKEGGK